MLRVPISIYRMLHRCYPPAFRADFALEMESVFAESLEAAAGRGAVIRLCMREFCTLPILALHEHLIERTSTMTLDSPFQKRRNTLRAASLLTTGFLLVSSLLIAGAMGGYSAQHLVLIIFVFHAIMAVAVLTAFRWERAGGIIILTSAATLGAILLAVFLTSGLAGAALLSCLWMLPYAVLGTLFILLSRRARVAA